MESEVSERVKAAAQCSSALIQESSFELPGLPAELIFLILLSLPVKSLLKFRCVSKSWLSLISSNEFVDTHLSISANNMDHARHRLILKFNSPGYELKDCSLSSLLYDSVVEAFDLDYPMKDTHQLVRIVGSVNGLVCLAINDKTFFIWNPSLRKFKKLPNPTATYNFLDIYGFGYDELFDDYKVVIGYLHSLLRVMVSIYSLNSDTWRSIDDFPRGSLCNIPGVFVNGKLHWATVSFQSLYSYFGWDIISMDGDEEMRKVEQPCYRRGDFEATLGVWGSNLSVVCFKERAHTDVWVMKEYGVKESWTKMFTVKLPNDPMDYDICRFVCMPNKGEMVFQFRSTFLIYYPKDDSIRYFKVTGCDAIFVTDIFIESLVWPHFIAGTWDATAVKAEKVKMKAIVL